MPTIGNRNPLMTKTPMKLSRKPTISKEALRLTLLNKDPPKDKKGRALKAKPKNNLSASKNQPALLWALSQRRAPKR